MDSERPAEPGSPAPHCVVWHAPGVTPPADLMAALGKHHVSIDFRTGPFEAFAEVCALERMPRGAGPHGHAAHGVILVLVRAKELEDAGAVVRAMELYVPHARCWRYEPGAPVQLKAVVSAELEADTPAPPVEAAPKVVVTPQFRRGAAPPPAPGAKRHPAQGRPALRLAGEGVLPARPEPEDEADGGKVREVTDAGAPADAGNGNARQVLTQDELAMLLSEDTVDVKGKAVPPRRAGDVK